ncbi:EEF1A lysine methyltransferase 1 [Holothuria leucospilota]|uniref:Protein-lysine N-methyltransferase HOLleu_24079 n=1 Tax=Holothuria leucospilota TaxID=206669 RepID=A0A9Q1H610_HOLLE|nr:EEF1A lysine methyltransferase 1 [Holothuria leucospilota]
MSSDSDEDDVPQLSAHALAALQEFYAEQTAIANEDEEEVAAKVGGIQEDWQLSQFWYDDDTASVLANEAITAAGVNGRIACISTPTLFQKLRQINSSCSAIIFEYDKRFEVYGDHFVFYDFNKPLELPEHIKAHSFDIVIGDPPFLTDDCLEPFSQTMKLLAKDKMILCTGAVMEASVKKLLDLEICNFQPKHAKNLANEFRCFANYTTTYLNNDR